MRISCLRDENRTHNNIGSTLVSINFVHEGTQIGYRHGLRDRPKISIRSKRHDNQNASWLRKRKASFCMWIQNYTQSRVRVGQRAIIFRKDTLYVLSFIP